MWVRDGLVLVFLVIVSSNFLVIGFIDRNRREQLLRLASFRLFLHDVSCVLTNLWFYNFIITFFTKIFVVVKYFEMFSC